jgi:hypothetical protein
MRYRIGMWAIAGFLLAGFWALFAAATFPSAPERMCDLWTVVCITCPVGMLGMHYPVSLYVALVANAFTYGFIGLAVEALRKQLHQAQ